MIRTNLSTRPFYNERAVHFWLLILALVAIAATLFNVSRMVKYSGSNTELASAAARDERQAAELRANAVKLRSSVDPRQIEAAAVDARQANDLIDRRTFSWTELFNRFERTLPADVRITSVRPTIDKDRRIVLSVGVLARSVDAVDQFMENLDQTGAFARLTPVQEHTNEEGQIESVLECEYVPYVSSPTAASDSPAIAPAGGRP